MAQKKDTTIFGTLLKEARIRAGISRAKLAQNTGLDPSHIYRLETGDRSPSRESVIAMAEILNIDTNETNLWLVTVGFNPLPHLNALRRHEPQPRSPGRGRRPKDMDENPSFETALWANSLEAMGIDAKSIPMLAEYITRVPASQRHKYTKGIGWVINSIFESIDSPVKSAILPFDQPWLSSLADHHKQMLLMGLIEQVLDAQITNIDVILEPHDVERIFNPLVPTLRSSMLPWVKIQSHNSVDTLGAMLESIVGRETWPFMVVDPQFGIKYQGQRAKPENQIKETARTFYGFMSRPDVVLLFGYDIVPSTYLSKWAVAEIGEEEIDLNTYWVLDSVSKPDPTDRIIRSRNPVRIVGPYIFNGWLDKLKGVKDIRFLVSVLEGQEEIPRGEQRLRGAARLLEYVRHIPSTPMENIGGVLRYTFFSRNRLG